MECIVKSHKGIELFWCIQTKPKELSNYQYASGLNTSSEMRSWLWLYRCIPLNSTLYYQWHILIYFHFILFFIFFSSAPLLTRVVTKEDYLCEMKWAWMTGHINPNRFQSPFCTCMCHVFPWIKIFWTWAWIKVRVSDPNGFLVAPFVMHCLRAIMVIVLCIMTSHNGNTFRVIGPLSHVDSRYKGPVARTLMFSLMLA